jgi:phage-related protein
MGSFFSATSKFSSDLYNYTFTAVPHFFFNDVPKLLWALPDLIRDIFNAIVTFIEGIFNSLKTYFKAIFTFIGAFFSLIGGFFKTLKAFFEIF